MNVQTEENKHFQRDSCEFLIFIYIVEPSFKHFDRSSQILCRNEDNMVSAMMCYFDHIFSELVLKLDAISSSNISEWAFLVKIKNEDLQCNSSCKQKSIISKRL